MTERPTAQELAEAVLEFLGDEILPTLTDHRLRFRTLVSMNALGAGDVQAGTLERVKEDVRRKLEVVSPRYLERYE